MAWVGLTSLTKPQIRASVRAEVGLHEASQRAVQALPKSEPRAAMLHESGAGELQGEETLRGGEGGRVTLRPATCEGPGKMGTGEDGSGEGAGCR